ncbi:DUF2142 domain-containing protein [Alpinimonas psychrophila]
MRIFFQGLRSRFKPISIAPILLLLVLASWSLASPVGSAPDDDFHLDSIWCGGSFQTGVCEAGPTTTERIVPRFLPHAPCYSFIPSKSAACQGGPATIESGVMATTDRGNFQNNYPPVFYSFMRLFVGSSIEGSVLVMRLVNSLIFVAFTTTLWFLSPPRIRRMSAIMWPVTLLPLGLFLVTSNNPSSWAIMGVAFAFTSLLSFFAVTKRGPLVALGGLFLISTVMAAGARGDAAIYAVIASLAAMTLSFTKSRAFAWKALLPLAGLGISLIFYFMSQQAGVASTGLGGATAGSKSLAENLGVLVSNVMQLPALWIGVFGESGLGSVPVTLGNLGWLDTQMPMLVWVPALFVAMTAFFTGLRHLDMRKTLALCGVAAALIALPLYVLQVSLSRVGSDLQPRYLLPLIVVIMAVALYVKSGHDFFVSRGQIVVWVGMLGVAQSLALHVNMRRYITGTDVLSMNLNQNIEWWWSTSVGPQTVWIIGSISWFLLLLLIFNNLHLSGEKHVKTHAAFTATK